MLYSSFAARVSLYDYFRFIKSFGINNKIYSTVLHQRRQCSSTYLCIYTIVLGKTINILLSPRRIWSFRCINYVYLQCDVLYPYIRSPVAEENSYNLCTRGQYHFVSVVVAAAGRVYRKDVRAATGRGLFAVSGRGAGGRDVEWNSPDGGCRSRRRSRSDLGEAAEETRRVKVLSPMLRRSAQLTAAPCSLERSNESVSPRPALPTNVQVTHTYYTHSHTHTPRVL